MKKRHIFLSLFVLLLVGVAILWVVASHPKPEGKAGPAADALAREVGKAAKLDGWARTGAIAWNFGGRYLHLWDRKRQLSRVRWGKGRKRMEVLFAIGHPKEGVATRGGKKLAGKDLKEALETGYKRWCNDSFWLNPLAKLFDKGVVRKLVTRDGQKHLLIEFTSGGVTPGDTYFFVLGANKLPLRWHMFVSIIPVKGLQASFDGWETLTTGAKVSTVHKLGPLKLKLTEIKAATTLKGLYPKADPFKALVGGSDKPKPRTRPAASRPVDRTDARPNTRRDATPPRDGAGVPRKAPAARR